MGCCGVLHLWFFFSTGIECSESCWLYFLPRTISERAKSHGRGGDCHSRGEMIITRTARSKQMNRMTTEYSVGLASEVDKTIANDPQKFPFLILHLLDCIFLRSELEDT